LLTLARRQEILFERPLTKRPVPSIVTRVLFIAHLKGSEPLAEEVIKHQVSEEERMADQQQSFPHTQKQWLTEGNRLFALKQYAEALDAYEQALLLDPASALAYENKGSTLYRLERYAEALAACEQALQLDPTCGPAYGCKFGVLFRLRRYKEAVGALKQGSRQANF
jgi:tetratricopeptide (TPR) repeat protein